MTLAVWWQGAAWWLDPAPTETAKARDLPNPPLVTSNAPSTWSAEERLSGLDILAAQQRAPSVWISEVYPVAGQGRNDAAFEWLELSNDSETDIPLSGWTLADNTSADPLDGAVVPAGGSLIIAASEQAVDPGALTAAFVVSDGRIGNGLANTGDHVRLIDADGSLVAAVSWGADEEYGRADAPSPDQSIHRSAVDAPLRLGSPTPGSVAVRASATPTAQPAKTAQADEASPPPAATAVPAAIANSGALAITEIMPAPLSGQAEWVELVNLGPEPVDLAGWTLADSTSQTLLEGTISAGGRLVISTQPLAAAAGDVHVVKRIGNGLNNDGDTITLLDANGDIIDEIQYGKADLPAPARGNSIALNPGRWVVTAEPTPGTAEVTPLIADVLRSPTAQPERSEDQPLPPMETTNNSPDRAWMIVSFALIGVILVLIVRRWSPLEPEPTPTEGPAPASFSGPTREPAEPAEEPRER